MGWKVWLVFNNSILLLYCSKVCKEKESDGKRDKCSGHELRLWKGGGEGVDGMMEEFHGISNKSLPPYLFLSITNTFIQVSAASLI